MAKETTMIPEYIRTEGFKQGSNTFNLQLCELLTNNPTPNLIALFGLLFQASEVVKQIRKEIGSDNKEVNEVINSIIHNALEVI